MERPNGVIARLDALHEDIRDIKAWTERHEAQHGAISDSSRERAVALERRLTSLEGSVSRRSTFGAVGIVISWIAAALGLAPHR